MKKLLIMFVLCCMLGSTACNTKAKEEALAQTTEVISEPGEISFTLNGYWSFMPEEEIASMDVSESQSVDLSATHIETGTNISIIYDDLTKKEGGTLVRIEDYVEAIEAGMKNSSDYTYQCSEISSTNLGGKEYLTFAAETTEVQGVQHFFIRRIEDSMMVMMITLQVEDRLEDILKMMK